MEFTTLDVPTADGHTLKLGAYRGGADISVLVLHGLFSHMGWYRPMAESLAAHGASVFLLDRRGAGISEGLAGHMESWLQVVDDLQRAVARIKDLQPGASLCALGISLGAPIMLAASLLQADTFQRMAALSPGLAPGAKVPLRRRLRVLYSAYARPRHLWDLPFTADQLSDQEELRQALWSDPLRTRAVTSRFLLEVFRLQHFVRRNITRLHAPLLALVAGKDSLVDNDVLLQTLKRVGGTPVRIEIYPQAYHVLPASVPLAELVDRIWHWFSAPESSLERRVVIQEIPSTLAASAASGEPVGESPTACELIRMRRGDPAAPPSIPPLVRVVAAPGHAASGWLSAGGGFFHRL